MVAGYWLELFTKGVGDRPEPSYRLQSGAASIWLEGGELNRPKGLRAEGNRLLVGCSGDPALKAINLNPKKVTLLARLYPGAIMDGIQPIGDEQILFCDINGHLFLLKPSTEWKITRRTSVKEAVTCLMSMHW